MYCGIYRTKNNSNVVKQIATTSRKDLSFPGVVIYEDETYNLKTTMIVDTPNRKKEFEEYCNLHSIETDVSI